MYQTNELAELAGITPRAVRYYEKEGLLKARREPENNYRLFDEQQVDRLQQILFYRELDLPIQQIKRILSYQHIDRLQILTVQKQALQAKRQKLDALIRLADQTIIDEKGQKHMTDEEKFTAFKRQMLKTNEQKYGDEIREKYGRQIVEEANAKMLHMTAADYERFQNLEKDLFKQLITLLATQDLNGPEAKQVFEDHKSWLKMTWTSYSPATHRGLAEMYLQDNRFQSYYDDKVGVGATALLCKIIKKYAK
ncbi:MAG: MerR family transcriptional regulator [Oenococcus sp.]|uniref:MerR family transcriptional regulator n=1 Tax=Oenococcus TaxID=46254 RepID=UPI0021E875E4|nr:MerR family transcriptional regulator [Oenococcus kitaharae]MCV3296594.1 MerR family transcriptional regulator [Oenococcus kitaharae]